jgi:hypothetical protein
MTVTAMTKLVATQMPTTAGMGGHAETLPKRNDADRRLPHAEILFSCLNICLNNSVGGGLKLGSLPHSGPLPSSLSMQIPISPANPRAPAPAIPRAGGTPHSHFNYGKSDGEIASTLAR